MCHQDQNDFTPQFERSTYDAPSLLETASPGTPILSVTASDADPEVRGHILNFLNLKC